MDAADAVALAEEDEAELTEDAATAISAVLRGRAARHGAVLREAKAAAAARRQSFATQLRGGLLVEKRCATDAAKSSESGSGGARQQRVQQRELRLEGVHAFAAPSTSSALRLLCGHKTVALSLITAVQVLMEPTKSTGSGVGGSGGAGGGDGLAANTRWIAMTFSGPGGPSGNDAIVTLTIRLPTTAAHRSMLELLRVSGCFIAAAAPGVPSCGGGATADDPFNAGASGFLDTDVIVLREEQAIDNFLANRNLTKPPAKKASEGEQEEGDEGLTASSAGGVVGAHEEVDGTAQVAVQPDSKKSRVVRLSWDASVDVPKKVVRVLTSEDLSGGVDGVVEEGEEEEAQAQDS